MTLSRSANPALKPQPGAALLAQLQAGQPGSGHGWLDRLRGEAGAAFVQTGLPTLKLEDWKFTSLAALSATAFRPFAPGQAIDREAIAPHLLSDDAHLMVFVGGRFSAALSRLAGLPDGVTITALGQQLEAGEAWLSPYVAPGSSGALIALNSALTTDGAVIRVGRDVAVLRPIQLLSLSGDTDSAAAHPRHVIVLEAGAEATVLETHAAHPAHAESQVYWTNAVGRIEVGAGATLRHYKRQVEGASAFHLAESEVTLAAGANYESFVLSAGAKLARNEIEVRMIGDGASCRLDSLGLMKQSSHGDTTTRIHHESLGGSSSQLAKNVVADKAHSVFQGRIRVAPGAQKTDARQINHNLLLSQGAGADAKPELEILADDVKCSHGATVGDLEPDGLFYLRARGLDEEAARLLLVEGFAGEAIENISDTSIRAHLKADLRRWLDGLRV